MGSHQLRTVSRTLSLLGITVMLLASSAYSAPDPSVADEKGRQFRLTIEDKLNRLFKRIDRDDNGRITFPEYRRFLINKIDDGSLPPENLIRGSFEHLDNQGDGDGTLTLDEILFYVRGMDLNGNGRVNFSEFRHWFLSQLPQGDNPFQVTNDQLREFFDYLDTDNDGTLSIKEIVTPTFTAPTNADIPSDKSMAKTGKEIGSSAAISSYDKLLKQFLDNVDRNGDKLIDGEELRAFLATMVWLTTGVVTGEEITSEHQPVVNNVMQLFDIDNSGYLDADEILLMIPQAVGGADSELLKYVLGAIRSDKQ